MSDQTSSEWWKRGVIYQVYPRSFADSNGDGVGDLAGIIERLDHLRGGPHSLGLDAIWLSPIYPSPLADFGYDVSDYTAIDPIYGDLASFDALVSEAHRRGLRVLLDLIPGHTSVEHPWFVAALSSRSDAKRDWYLWADPAPDGGPPNNWMSVFGGSAWEWDEATGQFYYHGFARQQPDLNWRNPAVREAMLDAMRFWLERGVDGFRVDVIWHLIKDERWRDNPRNPSWREGDPDYERVLPVFSTDQPEVHPLVAAMRSLTDEYDERLLIGEIYLPIARLVTYYGHEGRGAHLPFNFQLLLTDWEARKVEALIGEYEGSLPRGAWPNWVLGNHDNPRVVTRLGEAQARVAAMLLLTLRGTPTLYNGEEIGMRDVPVPAELVRDPAELNEPGKGRGRDPHRTPMQWDASRAAGFTSRQPWLPVGDDYATHNVAAQRDDPDSMLGLHRRLLALRRSEPALSVGAYVPVPCEGSLLAYLRQADGARFAAVLNLGSERARFAPRRLLAGSVAVATDRSREGARLSSPFELGPDEGLLLRLD
jgi:alpha-glucosidase